MLLSYRFNATRNAVLCKEILGYPDSVKPIYHLPVDSSGGRTKAIVWISCQHLAADLKSCMGRNTKYRHPLKVALTLHFTVQMHTKGHPCFCWDSDWFLIWFIITYPNFKEEEKEKIRHSPVEWNILICFFFPMHIQNSYYQLFMYTHLDLLLHFTISFTWCRIG